MSITARVRRQVSGLTTRRRVTGFTPPSASVAAITARSVAVTSRAALARVDVRRLVRVEVHPAVPLQQPRHRLVASVRGALGLQGRLVQLQLTAREPGEPLAQEVPLQVGGAPWHQAGGGDRPGVDHRVRQAAIGQLDGHHGVERQAGGVDAESLAGLAVTEGLADEGELERLGDALDGERCRGVADGLDVSFDVGHRDAEQVRRGTGERRDVGRDLSVVDVGVAAVRLLDQLAHGLTSRHLPGRDLAGHLRRTALERQLPTVLVTHWHGPAPPASTRG